MKKTIKLFSILCLTVSMLAGCSGSKVINDKTVAEEFVRNIYTVDSSKITELHQLNATPGPIIGVDVSTEKSKPSEAYIKIMKSLDKKIEPLMAKGAYDILVANDFNLTLPIICDKGNYTSKVTKFTLGENVYANNKDKNKVRYSYEITLEFMPNDGTASKADTSKGVIELINEDGQWKVGLYTISVYPERN